MKKTAFFLIVASLLGPAPKAHADLLVDFADGSTDASSYVTDDDPFGNAILLRVVTGSATFTGGTSGTGEIYKSGAGSLLMTGIYSHLGATTIRGGIVELTGQITQSRVFGVGWDNAGGELLLRSGGSIVSGPVFIGPFATSGTTIATLDGPSTTWTVVAVTGPDDPGTVRVGDLNDGTMVIRNGALMTSARGHIGRLVGADGFATVTGTNSRWLNTEQLLIGNEGGGSLTISAGGRVENSFARIGEQVDSTGTVLVTGANSTWMSSGDLFVGNLGMGTLTISDGGTVTSVGTSRIGDKSDSMGTVSVTGANSSWTNVGGLIVGNDGHGSLTVSAAAQVVSGFSVVGSLAESNGTLQLDGTAGSQGVLTTARLRTGDGTALLNWNGGILRATESRTDFLLDFAAGEIDVQAGGAFIDSNGFDVGSNSALIGAGGLAKIGAGTLTYTGSAFLLGTSAIDGGGLKLDSGASFLTGGIGVGRAPGTTGTLRVTGAGSVLDGGNFITVGDGLGSTGTLTVDGGGLVRMVAGAKLTVGWQNATGTLNLDSGGTIEIGGTDGLQKHATGTTTINFGGGTLRVVNSALTTSLPIALTTGNSTIDTNGFDATLSGGVSGAGGLIKTGAGTLTLSAPSSYAGTTQLDAGSLIAGVSGAFVTGQPFIVNGGILDLNGTSAQVSRLSGNGGTVFIGTGTLEVDGAVSTNFAGSVSGVGNFVKEGISTLNLTGVSSFNGITAVNGGSLRAFSGGNYSSFGFGVGRAAGTSGILVAAGAGSVLTATNFLTVGDGPGSTGILVVEGGGRVSLGAGAKLTIGWENATGTLNVNGSGVLEIGGANGLQKHPTGTSTVNLSGGIIRVVHSDLTTALDMNIGTTTSQVDTNGFDATLSGNLSGSGTLNKAGAGDLILTGANSMTGPLFTNGGGIEVRGDSSFGGFSVARLSLTNASVLVSGATLNAGAFATIGDGDSSNGTLTVENGGLLRLVSGAKLTVGWVNATGTLNLNPGGTVEIGGTDGLQKHATGTTQINFAGGTFRVVNSDLTSSLPMTIAGSSSTFDTNGLNATLSGALTGTGSLEKIGAGTLTLSGSNNYSGNTTISEGALILNGTVGDITLDGGSLAPGASPGTLNATTLDWLDGPIVFELGANAAASDLIVLSGALNGPGNLFNFTFENNGWLAGQTYELIRFGSTNITAAEFAFTNGNGFDGTFAFDGNSLEFTLVSVPEPGVAASLSLGLAALGFTRRRARS